MCDFLRLLVHLSFTNTRCFFGQQKNSNYLSERTLAYYAGSLVFDSHTGLYNSFQIYMKIRSLNIACRLMFHRQMLSLIVPSRIMLSWIALSGIVLSRIVIYLKALILQQDAVDGQSPASAMNLRRHRHSRSVGSYHDDQVI